MDREVEPPAAKKSKPTNEEENGMAVSYPVQLKHVAPSNAAWYEESLRDPRRFWGDLARQRLRWMEEFKTVMECDMNEGKIGWFLGGKINVSGENQQHIAVATYHVIFTTVVCLRTDNCLDRHVEQNPDRPALIWEKDEPNQHETVTYKYSITLIACMLLHISAGSCWG